MVERRTKQENTPIPAAAFIEIPMVSEKLYALTREVLARKGFTFVVTIKPMSISQLAADENAASLLEYICPSEAMRSNVPLRMEVAIDPNHPRIERSNFKSTDEQIQMIKEKEAIFKRRLPKEVRDIVSMIMSKHASILVQLDLEFWKRTGKMLFTNWSGCTDDQTSPGYVALVGRLDPTKKLDVGDRYRKCGNAYAFAVPVVMLPRCH